MYAALNYPGSWHDYMVAHMSGLIYPTRYEDEITPRVFAVLGHCALTSGRMEDNKNDKIVRGRKANESSDFVSMDLSAIDLIM